ncbi:MAG: ubiquinone-binding protein [Porticoccaceae bacterium]|nr:ubiquinone-binding protein [Porticoccaceae bacterium]
MHSDREMFDLVNDVEAYPAYMDECCGSEILERGDSYMVARLDLRKRGIHYSFTTRNTLKPFEEIRLELHSGPFRQLRGRWLFKALTDAACKVSLHLEFEGNNHLLNVAGTSLFASVANNLVAALTTRADAIYGKSQ